VVAAINQLTGEFGICHLTSRYAYIHCRLEQKLVNEGPLFRRAGRGWIEDAPPMPAIVVANP